MTVDNYNSVNALGVSSIGILAQSIGGGGGAGGFAVGAGFSTSGAASNTVGGGAGGGGGAAGTVTVTNHAGAIVHTAEANSTGILAQSIGGGGGAGAFSIAAGGSTGAGDGMSQSVGGAGGVASNGGTVTVTNAGTIETDGALSHGVYAQSVGGGGGSGGFSVSGAYSSAGGATSSVGGSGAGGGAGGDVNVTNSGTIILRGAGSVGIYAQSIGGGGGDAGFSGALNFTGGGKLTNTVGGAGGGGAGGNVTVISTGSIETLGAGSVAVVAQSIGGGGGSGSFAVAVQDGSLDGSALQVGGSGNGAQGANGTVNVEVSGGSIGTMGDLSYGLLSQAVGGGGGNGSLIVPDPLMIGALGSTQVVGASGTISGDGNPLNTQNANVVFTSGAGAIGFAGQSIGGGGGTSGVAGDVAFTAAGPLSLAAGGSTSGGGSGGAAVVSNSGSISTGGGPTLTSGDAAVGVLGQTIGGGGGSVLYALGAVTGSAGSVSLTLGGSEGGTDNGGALTFSSAGAILTAGQFAPGVVAQTIGGGGGFGALTAASGISAAGVSFQLGATGGAGGSADPTNASTWTIGQGSITTSGLLSDALVAQAIGAGGGLAGFVSDGAQNPTLTSAVLGDPGASGAGSKVLLASQSAITTSGVGAVGIIAQSIGGGGGVGQAYGVSAGGAVTLGGAGSGDGAAVTVTSSGAIATSGAEAHAILAQSIGGGGGFFQAFSSTGAPLPVVIPDGSGSGDGGEVTVNVAAPIETTGAGAHGVIAQSVAGGGGIVGGGEFGVVLPASGAFLGSAGGVGAAGAVTVNADANILATGPNSTGVVAASTDQTGRGGPITVSVASGVAVVGGVGSGGTPGNGDEPANAVRLIGGSSNLLTNNGFLATRSNIEGFVVTGGLGDDSIVNFGRMDGSVDLSAGQNAIDNKPSGVFNSGSVVWLGPLAAPLDTLTNEGLLSPGGYQNVYTTSIAGNLVQTPTGVYGMDLDLEPSNDLITVSGTANMAGDVFVNLVNPLTAPGFALPGAHTSTILTAAGGVTNSGVSLTAFDTAVVNYSLIYPDPHDIDLKYVIDYSPLGLTQNQHSVGNAINAIETLQVSPAFRSIATTLFYQPNVATLGQIYNSLSGEGVSAAQQTAFNTIDFYRSTMNNQTQRWLSDACGDDATGKTVYETPPALPTRKGEPAPVSPCTTARTWRIWGTGYGGTAQWPGDPIVGSASATEHVSGFSAGLDYQLNPNVLLGVSAGGGQSSFGVLNRSTWGSVDGWEGSIYGAWRNNRGLYAAGDLNYSNFDNKEQRSATIPGVVLPASNFVGGPYMAPGFAEQPQGSFGSHAWSGYGEVGYQAQYGALTASPFVGLELASLRSSGFTESNFGTIPSVIGLTYEARTINSLPSFVGLQLESNAALPNAMDLDFWARGAWKHEFDPSRSTESAFISAPGFDFVIQGAQAPRDSLVTSIGFKLKVTKNAALFGTFEGQFGWSAPSVGGTGRVVISW